MIWHDAHITNLLKTNYCLPISNDIAYIYIYKDHGLGDYVPQMSSNILSYIYKQIKNRMGEVVIKMARRKTSFLSSNNDSHIRSSQNGNHPSYLCSLIAVWLQGCPFHIFCDIEKGKPAHEAGLKDGDILIAVEGEGVLTATHEDCVKKIKYYIPYIDCNESFPQFHILKLWMNKGGYINW